MTVHKAKGLEFPVVILADLTCRMSRNDASRYLDASRGLCAMKIGGWAPHELHEHEAEEVARDQAEGVRLAYVAATRARDLLVVPALGDEPWDGGWFGPLNRALYPPVASRRTRGARPEVSGVQVEGLGAAAAQRRAGRQRRRSVPGCTPSTRASGYSVVWWDPGALKLGREAAVRRPPRGSDRQGRAEERHRRRPQPLRPLAAGARRRASGGRGAVARRSRPRATGSRRIRKSELQNSEFVTVVGAGRSGDEARSGGIGFGLLVHACSRKAPFGADARGARRPRGGRGARARAQRRGGGGRRRRWSSGC